MPDTDCHFSHGQAYHHLPGRFTRRSQIRVVSGCLLFALVTFIVRLPPALSDEVAHPLPFRVGERLTFRVTWFGIPAGQSELAVAGQGVYNGTPVLHFTSTARSNETFSLFYPVEDRFESLWDPVEQHPLFYRLRQREGFYRSKKQIILDQESNLALYKRNDEPTRSYLIRYGVQDALSSLYMLRALHRPVKAGDRISVLAFASKKNWETEVHIEAREVLRTRWGKIPVFRIRPKIKYSDGPLRPKGNVRFWATADRYRIPIRMTSAVMIIGRIKAELIKAEGIAEDSVLAKAIHNTRLRKGLRK